VTDRNSLTRDDFAKLFGVDRASLQSHCLELIDAEDWRYELIEGEELDRLILEVLDRVKRKDFSVVIPGDKSRWERGWGENLEAFLASKGDLAALAPKYVRAGMPVRIGRRFARTMSPHFEIRWWRVFLEWLFHAYFSDCDTIFEFGSGSGHNVALLAEMFPEKKIFGLDWAKPPCEIVNAMHSLRGWDTEGRLFNLFEPDYDLDIPSNSIVFTAGALEQVMDRHRPFIDFLLKKRPKLCVFIEPIYEWYDPANLADHLAIRAHDVRNFWKGFPSQMASLEAQGRVQIIKQKRAEFGSLLHEGYSQFIWRPS